MMEPSVIDVLLVLGWALGWALITVGLVAGGSYFLDMEIRKRRP